MEKILIKDIDKLRITKVNDYKVHFEYDGTKYILIDLSDGGDRCTGLYVRKLNKEKGYYYSKHINSEITLITPDDAIKFIGKGRVYSQINKEHFVKTLVELGFSDGLFTDEYNKYIKQKEDIEDKIDELRGKMSKLSSDWNKTSGHGSKTDSLKSKKKIAIAESIKGAKYGEWCEEYNQEYGSIHSVYGGVLRDLYNLPVGSQFFCTNGQWYGYISYNERGKKTVITDVGERELTPENHSLYIIPIYK